MKKSKKKIPKRMCLVCRQMLEKDQLERIVRSPEGQVAFDPTGKKPGKGAYICKEKACFEKLKKGGFLERALKSSIPVEVYEGLEETLFNGE